MGVFPRCKAQETPTSSKFGTAEVEFSLPTSLYLPLSLIIDSFFDPASSPSFLTSPRFPVASEQRRSTR